MITCSKLLIIKISELVLVAVILAIHVNEPYCNPEDKFLSAGTEVAFVIILVGLFAGGWLGTPVPRNVDLFFLVIGCGLFIASGATTIELWTRVVFKDKYRDMALARASLSILEGVVFLIDTFFTYRGEKFVR